MVCNLKRPNNRIKPTGKHVDSITKNAWAQAGHRPAAYTGDVMPLGRKKTCYERIK